MTPTMLLRRPVSLAKHTAPTTEPAIYPALHDAAAYAALHTGALGIFAPHDHWTGLSTGGAVTHLPNGITLIHQAREDGGALLAYARCPHRHEHYQAIDHADQVDTFRDEVRACPSEPTELPDLVYLPTTAEEIHHGH